MIDNYYYQCEFCEGNGYFFLFSWTFPIPTGPGQALLCHPSSTFTGLLGSDLLKVFKSLLINDV